MIERVKIHIDSTNQDTTATWALEGYPDSDIWICALSNIVDFKYMKLWNFSKVRMEFKDGRTRERMFYYDYLRSRLVQVNSDKLSFWTGKDNKESEGKSVKHNVTITRSEKIALEEYWTLLAMKKQQKNKPNENSIFLGNLIGTSGWIVDKKELVHEPTHEEIAQFLSGSNSDFASVEHNYRIHKEESED